MPPLKPVYAWLLMALTIGSEVFGSTCLKLSYGMTRLPWAALVVVTYGVTFYAFSVALKTLPLGLAYAVWSGVGTLGTFAVGALVFGEPTSPLRWAGVLLVIIGIGCLNAPTT